MLLNFTVSNFRSFKQTQTLSLEATNIKEHESFIHKVDKYKILPSAVIYGANSSGKSNVLKALSMMRHIVINSVRLNPDDNIEDYDPFVLSTETEKQPTGFEIELLIDTTKYRYGFEYDSQKIHSEWLYEQRQGEREYKLFLREETISYSSARFKEGERGIELTVEKNRLFLSLTSQLSGAISRKIIEWFRHSNAISGLHSEHFDGITAQIMDENSNKSQAVRQFLDKLQLGFCELKVKKEDINQNIFPKKIPLQAREQLLKQLLKHGKGQVVSIQTVHNIYDAEGNIKRTESFDKNTMESEGTQKLIELCGPIFDTLLNGKLLIIDELDAKLHPILTREIINLFNRNQTGAQFIFATHDTSLLSNKVFRRDQIWFTEKDKVDSTELYSLVEFKEDGAKVRSDRNFETDYINGRYGAIPYI